MWARAAPYDMSSFHRTPLSFSLPPHTQAGQAFWCTDEEKIEEHTPSWTKYLQLREILNARLSAIIDKYTVR